MKARESTANGRTAFFMSFAIAHLRITVANIRSFEQITSFSEEKFASFALFRTKTNKYETMCFGKSVATL
jgi:hypothetical protein